jgi:hypothetical protein
MELELHSSLLRLVLAVLPILILVGFMMADGAARNCTNVAMVPCEMTSRAADYGTFQTTFGIS